MTEVLHWQTIASHIKFKVNTLYPHLNLALPPAISLTLCANQCLQYLPALCALLIVWIFLSLVSGLPWLDVALLL